MRTPEDARYRPIPGDRYTYGVGASYEEALEIRMDGVLTRVVTEAGARDVLTPQSVWEYGPPWARWVPTTLSEGAT